MEASLTAAHIGVAAIGGIVTLTGQVESFAQKHAAEAAARRVKGVLAVAEEFEVQVPFERKRDDSDIAAAIVDRLVWDVSVPRDAVKVGVAAGWVTLTGEVDWNYQRKAAEQDVRRLHGVVGVSNQVSFKPRVNTANISSDISCALHRSYFPDPDAITVTAEEGKVRLTGNVTRGTPARSPPKQRGVHRAPSMWKIFLPLFDGWPTAQRFGRDMADRPVKSRSAPRQKVHPAA